MRVGESLIPEVETEMAGTRRTLERLPDDKLNWQAHDRSRTIGWVANHLAEIPGWVQGTLTQDVWDIHPEGGEPYQSPAFGTTREILELFDVNVAQAKESLAATPDTEFERSWSLLSGGQALITMPKIGVIRTWVLNHTIHHRGILTVYMRLNDLPVPGLYGPSGDEEM